MTLYDFCATLRQEDVYRDHPERVKEYWRRRNMLMAAIIDGDAEVAPLAARRCARLVTEWMVEDAGSRDQSTPAPDQPWAFLLAND
jgi:DNA-binding FadR family transcriptional regulator